MEIAFFYVLFILLGLSIGSFLNVCRYRIPEHKSLLTPSSHCKECLQNIHWYHNIPLISWIYLKGLCPYCNCKIPISYFFLELFTPIIFVLNIQASPVFTENTLLNIICLNLFSMFLILIALIDYQTFTIPNNIILFGSIFGLLIHLIIQIFTYNYDLVPEILFRILAGAFGFLILEILVLILQIIFKKQAFGMGDSKYLFFLGLWLGFKPMILSLNLAIYLAGIISMLLVTFKQLKRSQKIPFGPFLSVGAYLVCFFGDQSWFNFISKFALFG